MTRSNALDGLRRLAGTDGHFTMLAIDQRPPLLDLVSRRNVADIAESVVQIKRSVIQILQPHATAVLVDPDTALRVFGDLDRQHGLLLTLESHVFDATPAGRRSALIPDWTVERLEHVGADAVKLLAWYRPDAGPDVREHQERLVATVGDQCHRHGLPLVLELLTYPIDGDPVPVDGCRRTDEILESIDVFAGPEFGVDLFKVEPPPAPPPGVDSAVDERTFFRQVDRTVQRPWVLLSGHRERDDFVRLLRSACDAGASGFLAGRSIWWNAVERFPDVAEMERMLQRDAAPFMERLHDVVARHGRSWTEQVDDEA